MELLMDGFIFRFLHIFFGIIWIGILYYFNFVQVPFFAETDNATKSGAIQKLVPRALWWFRWGAMFTFLTGLILYYVRYVDAMKSGAYWESAGALIITLGALMGILMFLNVWLIIWPKQKILIASATAVAQGGQADPRAAAAGARAGVASRTNTLFSIPMLFFMTSAAHYPYRGDTTHPMFTALVVLAFLIIGAIELNAVMGKAVGPLTSVKGVVTGGFVLLAILYGATRLVSTL